jgi:hypothetical protein
MGFINIVHGQIDYIFVKFRLKLDEKLSCFAVQSELNA